MVPCVGTFESLNSCIAQFARADCLMDGFAAL